MKIRINNISKKALIAALCLTTLPIGAFAGCSPSSSQNQIDEGKTQLYVGNFNGGIGHKWIDEVVKTFEADYANYEFEPGTGKKGIQVIVVNKKEEYSATNLLSNMPFYQNDIYFLSDASARQFVASDIIMDITQIVEEDVYDSEGELVAKSEATLSIGDRVYPEYRTLYDLGTEQNPKWYALPFFTSVGGIIYDADLFNDYGLYFKADGSIGATQADIDAGNCSVGPDGIKGTSDDGCAETYTQFLKMLEQMRKYSITPFTWCNAHAYMRSYGFRSIFAAYEGYDDYMLNWTFDGTDSNQNLTVTPSTGDVLLDQDGRKAMLRFAKDVVSNALNYSNNAFSTQGHLEAQFEYINSINTDKRIAMFMEGGWWENESRDAFDSMALTDENLGYGKRNFKLMPIPRFVGLDDVPDQVNTTPVLYAGGFESLVCVAKQTKQLEAVKVFLQYVYARPQCVTFTQHTGAVKVFDYEIKASEKALMTPYTRSILDRMSEDGVKIACAAHFPGTPREEQQTKLEYWEYETIAANNKNYTNAFLAFKDKAFTSVADYIAGQKKVFSGGKWPIA